ncbi:hypothetical protein [Pantoea ananatis]|jgi:hypothetical protein|uniref:hypothetical protein n=1 Tax=Pantoea ananas TaxID=553 RepID=UPI001B31682F|nr:hypothetical protein [Pantoea ananatis]
MKNFLNYSVFFTTGLISQLVFALVGLASIWILSSIFTEGSIYFWSMSPPVFLGGFFIYKLWSKHDYYKHLNDALLYVYATYIAIQKILSPSASLLEVPLNVSFQEFWNGDNRYEYYNLMIIFLIATCTVGKAFISYFSFLNDYNKTQQQISALRVGNQKQSAGKKAGQKK